MKDTGEAAFILQVWTPIFHWKSYLIQIKNSLIFKKWRQQTNKMEKESGGNFKFMLNETFATIFF